MGDRREPSLGTSWGRDYGKREQLQSKDSVREMRGLFLD